MKNKRDTSTSQRSIDCGFFSSGSVNASRDSAPVNVSYLPLTLAKDLRIAKDPIMSHTFRSMPVNSSESNPRSKTFADHLSTLLIDLLQTGIYQCDSNGYFGDNLYQQCASVLSNTIPGEDNAELLIIYSKQMMMMMKKCGAVTISDGKLIVDENASSFEKIFRAFWDKLNWADLFPSMPSIAARMQDDRYIIAELLLSRTGEFSIDHLARDYFFDLPHTMSSLLLHVSFFDFSFFSWMRHFGIVSDVKSDDEQVCALLSPWGRRFLASLG